MKISAILLPIAGFVLAACSPASVDRTSASADALTNDAGTSGANSLVAQGFALVRTDTFAYEAQGVSTPSGLICVPDADGQICYNVMRDEPGSTVKGSADRYEHPDGRVAYLVAGGEIVGPVRRGTYVGTSPPQQGLPDVEKATLRVVDLAFDRYGNMGLSVAYGAESWERQNGGDWLTARHGGEATVTRGGSNTFGDGSFTVQFSSDGKAVREFYVAVPTHVLHMQDPKWSTLCVPYDCIDLKESHSYISGFDTKQECVARCVRPPNDVNYGPLGCQPALDTCWVPPPNHHH